MRKGLEAMLQVPDECMHQEIQNVNVRCTCGRSATNDFNCCSAEGHCRQLEGLKLVSMVQVGAAAQKPRD